MSAMRTRERPSLRLRDAISIGGRLLALASTLAFVASVTVASSPAPVRAIPNECDLFPCYTYSVEPEGDGAGSVVTTDSSYTTPDGAIDCKWANESTSGSKCSTTYIDLSSGGTGVLVYYVITPGPGSCAEIGPGDPCQSGPIRTTINVTSNGEFSVPVFSLERYSVIVSIGCCGSITSSPGGISCTPTCMATFYYGTVLTLTETPAPGYGFVGWAAPCAGQTGPTCRFTVTGNISTLGSFGPLHALTIVATGNGGGRVTSNPAGIDCTYDGSSGATCANASKATFVDGMKVKLTETPAKGSTFAGWTGAQCAGANLSTTCTFTISSPATVGVAFTRATATAGPTPPPGATTAPRPTVPSTPGAPGATAAAPSAGASPASSTGVEPSPSTGAPSFGIAEAPSAPTPTTLPADASSTTSSGSSDLTLIVVAIGIGAVVIAVAIVAAGLLLRRRRA